MADIKDFYRGDTQRYRLTLTDAETGDPIDITGGSMWFTMKAKITDNDADAVVQKHVTSHIDPANGVTEVVVEASDTVDTKPGTYYYDFQYVDSIGNVKTILAGKVKLLSDVTRTV
jgi:hypothetical protein